MERLVDDLLGNLRYTEDEAVSIDTRISQAAVARDANQVAQLLDMRNRAGLEAAVKRAADVQAAIFEKESERESLQRELEHLQEPVRVAAKAYADTLEILEQRHLDLAQLQTRQACIDIGLKSTREEISELRDELKKMMTVFGGEVK